MTDKPIVMTIWADGFWITIDIGREVWNGPIERLAQLHLVPAVAHLKQAVAQGEGPTPVDEAADE